MMGGRPLLKFGTYKTALQNPYSVDGFDAFH